VVVAVALCFILAGLLLFFLFPRTVNLSSMQPVLHPTNIYLNVSAKILSMTVTVRFDLVCYMSRNFAVFFVLCSSHSIACQAYGSGWTSMVGPLLVGSMDPLVSLTV